MKRKIDPVGKKYGKLLVLEQFSSPIQSTQKFRTCLLKLKCQCECGIIIEAYKGNVLYGKTTQCCHCQNSKITLGQKSGYLTVLSRDISQKKTKYLCKCECGDEDLYIPRYLLRGKKICCKKCRFPKKYGPQKPARTVKEANREKNYEKHLIAKKSLIGKKSGRLKIISFSHWELQRTRRRAYYRAKCKCGNEVVVRDCFAIKSCGCLHLDSICKGENQPKASLTNKEVSAIREFKRSNLGYTGRQLASMFDVSESVISGILKGKSYKERS